MECAKKKQQHGLKKSYHYLRIISTIQYFIIVVFQFSLYFLLCLIIIYRLCSHLFIFLTYVVVKCLFFRWEVAAQNFFVQSHGIEDTKRPHLSDQSPSLRENVGVVFLTSMHAMPWAINFLYLPRIFFKSATKWFCNSTCFLAVLKKSRINWAGSFCFDLFYESSADSIIIGFPSVPHILHWRSSCWLLTGSVLSLKTIGSKFVQRLGFLLDSYYMRWMLCSRLEDRKLTRTSLRLCRRYHARWTQKRPPLGSIAPSHTDCQHRVELSPHQYLDVSS